MPERKLSRRSYLTYTQSEKCQPTPKAIGEGSIYTLYQTFSLMAIHRKGSTRPAGYYHSEFGGSERQVEVRWLWTEDHRFFAPEIRVQPSSVTLKLVPRIMKALFEIRNAQEGPDQLAIKLDAMRVEYINDHKSGCWNDYRPLGKPGENPMMVIARASMGE